ncbi:ATP-binding protein [Sphingomonas sp.]|uniref:ATP-binding protein n=1 Tax=Sphingomonas sp. TaxID=28214 RepID=UPI002D80EF2F|nr:ATP-binding protein [Sphingomonas sp.]HEU0044826.1 ATP-binding protein [Sphingomonas sp.]
MKGLHPGFGLVGQLVAILLMTVLVEFGVSTLLYERASQFSVRDDEARRLAEHLTISRRLVAEQPSVSRPAAAAELSTDRYALVWRPGLPAAAPLAPSMDGMRRQILDWEPSLRGSDLRLHVVSPGHRSRVAGGLRLPDRSWLHFQTLQPVVGLNLATERVLLALFPALALMAVGGLLMRRALMPLRDLAAAADRLGDGSGEGAHVPEAGPGEVSRVIAAFNRMHDRIHALIDDRTHALAAVGHDFRTPLARLRLRAEGITDPARRDAIEADIGEMEGMIDSLLVYLGGGEEAEAPTVIDVAVICTTLVDDAADHGRKVAYKGPEHLPLRIRRSSMKRCLGNLVNNALRFGSEVSVTLTSSPGRVRIAVADNGPGIGQAMLGKVLEPFVRGTPERGRDTAGFGLGLSIVARLVELEGGRLTLANRAGGGLEAAIELPVGVSNTL